MRVVVWGYLVQTAVHIYAGGEELSGSVIQNTTIEDMTCAGSVHHDYDDCTVKSVDVQCVCHTADSRSCDFIEGDVIL